MLNKEDVDKVIYFVLFSTRQHWTCWHVAWQRTSRGMGFWSWPFTLAGWKLTWEAQMWVEWGRTRGRTRVIAEWHRSKTVCLWWVSVRQAPVTTEDSAKGILHVMSTLTEKHNGSLMDWEGNGIPWWCSRPMVQSLGPIDLDFWVLWKISYYDWIFFCLPKGEFVICNFIFHSDSIS